MPYIQGPNGVYWSDDPKATWQQAAGQNQEQSGANFLGIPGSPVSQAAPSASPAAPVVQPVNSGPGSNAASLNTGNPDVTSKLHIPGTGVNVDPSSLLPGSGSSLQNILTYGLPIGAAIATGIYGNSAINDATDALTKGGDTAIKTIQGGTDKAAGTLSDVYGQQKQALSPYTTAGAQGEQALAEGVMPGGNLVAPFTGNPNFSFTPQDLENDPGYQFRLQQGEQAIQAQEAATGNRFSPATSKALDEFAGQEASQEYQQAFARAQSTFQENYQNQFNQFETNQGNARTALQNLAGTGLSAAGTEVGAGSTFGSNMSSLQSGNAKAIADIQTQIASATASGDIAKANMLSSMLTALTQGVWQAGLLNAQQNQKGTTVNNTINNNSPGGGGAPGGGGGPGGPGGPGGGTPGGGNPGGGGGGTPGGGNPGGGSGGGDQGSSDTSISAQGPDGRTYKEENGQWIATDGSGDIWDKQSGQVDHSAPPGDATVGMTWTAPNGVTYHYDGGRWVGSDGSTVYEPSANGGDQGTPGGGDQGNPGGGDQGTPGGGDQGNPGGGDQGTPGGGNQSNPGGGDQNNPGGGDQSNPGGGSEFNGGSDGTTVDPNTGERSSGGDQGSGGSSDGISDELHITGNVYAQALNSGTLTADQAGQIQEMLKALQKAAS
jgi:hypothetical protein